MGRTEQGEYEQNDVSSHEHYQNFVDQATMVKTYKVSKTKRKGKAMKLPTKSLEIHVCVTVQRKDIVLLINLIQPTMIQMKLSTARIFLPFPLLHFSIQAHSYKDHLNLQCITYQSFLQISPLHRKLGQGIPNYRRSENVFFENCRHKNPLISHLDKLKSQSELSDILF